MEIVICLLLAAAPPARAGADGVAEHRSATEINKQVTNPVTTTWSLKWKNTVSSLAREGASDRGEYSLKFQPTLPVVLTPQWKLITRPEFTLIEDKPFTDAAGTSQRTTGVGDTILDMVIGPMSAHWLLGLGPTFIFPTANPDVLGQGKWQIGPGAVAGYLAQHWLAALILQQWWSYGGSGSASISQMHLQYLGSWFFSHGWSVGTSPTIKFEWTAAAGNEVTFPLGLSVAKVVKFGSGFPVHFEIQGLYAPVHPDSYGEKFALQIYITPVIPSLIVGPVFDDDDAAR